MTFVSERDKKSAEGKLAALQKSKGGSSVKSTRPEPRPYKSNIRDSYKQMKTELWHYWQQICNRDGYEYLNVPENVWSKNIFIYQRFSGKGADSKLYYEITDPTNLESWLVFNREQNPFSGLDFSKEVPNRRYAEIAGSRAKTLEQSGIQTMNK